jgi:hypothetical protein
MMSAVLPAGKPTRMRTGLEGNSCAWQAPEKASAESTSKAWSERIMGRNLPLIFRVVFL